MAASITRRPQLHLSPERLLDLRRFLLAQAVSRAALGLTATEIASDAAVWEAHVLGVPAASDPVAAPNATPDPAEPNLMLHGAA